MAKLGLGGGALARESTDQWEERRRGEKLHLSPGSDELPVASVRLV